MTDEELLKASMSKEVDELYLELGKQLASSAQRVIPLPPFRYIQVAKQWLSDHKREIKERVCADSSIKALLSNNRIGDRLVVAAAVCDLISSITVGLSPVTVAVLLVKEGLRTLCEGEE